MTGTAGELEWWTATLEHTVWDDTLDQETAGVVLATVWFACVHGLTWVPGS